MYNKIVISISNAPFGKRITVVIELTVLAYGIGAGVIEKTVTSAPVRVDVVRDDAARTVTLQTGLLTADDFRKAGAWVMQKIGGMM